MITANPFVPSAGVQAPGRADRPSWSRDDLPRCCRPHAAGNRRHQQPTAATHCGTQGRVTGVVPARENPCGPADEREPAAPRRYRRSEPSVSVTFGSRIEHAPWLLVVGRFILVRDMAVAFLRHAGSWRDGSRQWRSSRCPAFQLWAPKRPWLSCLTS